MDRRRLAVVIGVLAVAITLVFLFAPIVSYSAYSPPDVYFKGQVSPSYFYFGCGAVSNLYTQYTENNQVTYAFHGVRWLCR